MNDESVRAALLLRVCMEVLRELGRPATEREVLNMISERIEFTSYELERAGEGLPPRWERHLLLNTGDVATVGWMTKLRGWSITEAGEAALDAFSTESLWAELGRLLADNKRSRKQEKRQAVVADQRITDVLDAVGPGFWVSRADLVELTGLAPHVVEEFLKNSNLAGCRRVLDEDGVIPRQSLLNERYTRDDLVDRLVGEGLRFDSNSRASWRQQLTVEDLRALLVGPKPEAPLRRAWVVRGSSVEGQNLVPVWLRKDSVSLAASSLRVVSPPLSRTDLKAFVDEDYGHKSYSARESKVTEFDAFCNRMKIGDLVLTTAQGNTYIGEVIGDAEYTNSSDQRSNLRRAVTWLNESRPMRYNTLPDPLPAKLGDQSDVIDLTEDIAAVESMLRELNIEIDTAAPTSRRTLEFPLITPELAHDLMISDTTWLDRITSLLWHRRQIILYGPPGTGKTYIARKLAQHLAEPSAVKLVQFHPSYTYEDFFEGFRPVLRDDGQPAFELRPGPFRALVDDAREHQADPYILIIDEINRSNLSKVFGELYFLLEYRDENVDLMHSRESNFTLPKNVFIIGTMNTSDRSIALVDAAMRRRFAFVGLHPSEPPTNGFLREWLRRRVEAGEVSHHADAAELLDALNATIDDREHAIGPSYLMQPYIYRSEHTMAEVWETSILPLLEEHHYGGPREALERYRLEDLRKTLDNPPTGS